MHQKLPQANQLMIKFTAQNSLFDEQTEIREIRDELIDLTRTLQKSIGDCGITIKPHQLKPDWKQWTLTIQAEPALLDQMANLIYAASIVYLSSNAKTGIGFFQSPSTE